MKVQRAEEAYWGILCYEQRSSEGGGDNYNHLPICPLFWQFLFYVGGVLGVLIVLFLLSTANEAASMLQKQESLQAFKATLDDLLSDVQDNFHLFNGLENMLKSPPRLQNQQIYQIDEDTQNMLIEK